MKFITPILLAAAASTVYGALPVKLDHFNKLPVECQQELNTSNLYNNCADYQPTIDTYKERCAKMLGPECQEFYNDPMKYLPKCKGTDVENYFSPEVMVTSRAAVNFVCIPDEEGNICPLAELYVKGLGTDDEHVKYTCHSQKCVDNGIAMYSASFGGHAKLSKTPETKNAKQLIVESLSSQECNDILAGKIKVEKPAEVKIITPNSTSDAITNLVKLGSTFIISLGLLLYLH